MNDAMTGSSYTLVIGEEAARYRGIPGVIEPEDGAAEDAYGPSVLLVPTELVDGAPRGGHPADNPGPSADWLMANS